MTRDAVPQSTETVTIFGMDLRKCGAIFFLPFLFACGGRDNSKPLQIRFQFQSPPANPLTRPGVSLSTKDRASYPLPQTDTAFDCYAVNVMAADIPSQITSLTADSNDDIKNGHTCSYPGILSPVIPASNTSTSVQLKVPAGSSRVIQVLGIRSPTGCNEKTNGTLAAHFLATHFDDDIYPGIYEIGRTVVDTQGFQTITVPEITT